MNFFNKLFGSIKKKQYLCRGFKKNHTKTTLYINHFKKITIMKKIFFSIFAVAALALTSCAGAGGANVLDMDPAQCDDTTEKCWVYTVSYAGAEADTHLWGTEKYLVETIQKAYGSISGYTVTLSPADADSMEACYGL